MDLTNEVTFNANGGRVTITKKTVTQGLTYGSLPTPTRSKYIFKGWYTAKSKGTKITSDSKVDITSNQTLYAQWEKVTVERTKISKLTSKKVMKVRLKYKKISGAVGYQILYSTNNKFKKAKNTKMATKTSLTWKKLKTGKTYYFKSQSLQERFEWSESIWKI